VRVELAGVAGLVVGRDGLPRPFGVDVERREQVVEVVGDRRLRVAGRPHEVVGLRVEEDVRAVVGPLEDAPAELRVGVGAGVLALVDEPLAVHVEDDAVLVAVDAVGTAAHVGRAGVDDGHVSAAPLPGGPCAGSSAASMASPVLSPLPRPFMSS
jgi:hypothetical protein